jgi:hypothetical protein
MRATAAPARRFTSPSSWASRTPLLPCCASVPIPTHSSPSNTTSSPLLRLRQRDDAQGLARRGMPDQQHKQSVLRHSPDCGGAPRPHRSRANADRRRRAARSCQQSWLDGVDRVDRAGRRRHAPYRCAQGSRRRRRQRQSRRSLRRHAAHAREETRLWRDGKDSRSCWRSLAGDVGRLIFQQPKKDDRPLFSRGDKLRDTRGKYIAIAWDQSRSSFLLSREICASIVRS